MKFQVLSETDFEKGIKALKEFLKESDESTDIANQADLNRLSSEFELAGYKGSAPTFIQDLLDQINLKNENSHLTPEELLLLIDVTPKSWRKMYMDDGFLTSVIPSDHWHKFRNDEWVDKQKNRYQASLNKVMAEFDGILEAMGIEDTAEGIKINTEELPVTEKNIKRIKNIITSLRDAIKMDVRNRKEIDDKRGRYYQEKFSEISSLLSPKRYKAVTPTFSSTKKPLKFKRKA